MGGRHGGFGFSSK